MQRLLHSWMHLPTVGGGEGLVVQVLSPTLQGSLAPRRQTLQITLLRAPLITLTREMMKVRRRKKRMMMKRRWSTWLQIIPKKTLGMIDAYVLRSP